MPWSKVNLIILDPSGLICFPLHFGHILHYVSEPRIKICQVVILEIKIINYCYFLTFSNSFVHTDLQGDSKKHIRNTSDKNIEIRNMYPDDRQ